MDIQAHKKILITGGVRSGKSRYAMNLALSYPAPRIFVATAEALDEGMRERIAKHQAERKGDFLTVEEPVHLAASFRRLEVQPAIVVVDCLTVWINNLLYHFSGKDEEVQKEIQDLIEEVQRLQFPMIFVTNEVGLGVMPENPLARRYMDQLGAVNQSFAALCDEVVMMISGIPQGVKGTRNDANMDQPVAKY